MRDLTSRSDSGPVAKRIRRCTSPPWRCAAVWCGANGHGGSVALTRATQRLGVLHQGPLPQALTGLAETGTPAQAGQIAYL
jgi:hypothetical protein